MVFVLPFLLLSSVYLPVFPGLPSTLSMPLLFLSSPLPPTPGACILLPVGPPGCWVVLLPETRVRTCHIPRSEGILPPATLHSPLNLSGPHTHTQDPALGSQVPTSTRPHTHCPRLQVQVCPRRVANKNRVCGAVWKRGSMTTHSVE